MLPSKENVGPTNSPEDEADPELLQVDASNCCCHTSASCITRVSLWSKRKIEKNQISVQATLQTSIRVLAVPKFVQDM